MIDPGGLIVTSSSAVGTVDWGTRRLIAESVLETAGLTPLVRLHRVVADLSSAVLVKLEFFSPTGSVKDRIVPYMIAAAEARGELVPGMTIIEGTSGNTGIATAMSAAAKGYPAVIVMPDGMSAERREVIKAFGAKLVLTPGVGSDVDLVVEKVKEIIAACPGEYWWLSQFDNPDNPRAHYETTGPEIWDQTAGSIDAFVAAEGTGGTVTGTSRFLKARKPTVQAYTVEPEECAILSGGERGTHQIEGIGDGFIPEVLDLKVLDGVIKVSSEESIAITRRLAREEGIFCGVSSGCNVAAALKLARVHPELQTIVTLINDDGLRYLSTDLWRGMAKTSPRARPLGLDETSQAKLADAHLEIIS
jgi:cysteine synthase A